MHLEDLVLEQRVGDVEEGGRPVLAHRLAKAAAHGGEQRLPDAERRPQPRGDPVHALVVLGIGQALEARVDGGREHGGLVDEVARLPSEREGGGRPLGDEGAGALRRRRDGPGIRCGRGHPASTSSGVSFGIVPRSGASSGTTRNAYLALSSSFRDSGAAT